MMMIRLNVISKQNEAQRVSLSVPPATPLLQLKRLIQQQFMELHNQIISVKQIEDDRGFMISNRSTAGEHFSNNSTLYVIRGDGKEPCGMDNIGEIFINLRWSCASIITKLQVVKGLQLSEVVGELIYLGFWYTNAEIVKQLLDLLNGLATEDAVRDIGQEIETKHFLIFRFIAFWLTEVKGQYGDIRERVLLLTSKLMGNHMLAEMMKTHRMMQAIKEIEKGRDKEAEIARRIIKRIDEGSNAFLPIKSNANSSSSTPSSHSQIKPRSHPNSDYTPTLPEALKCLSSKDPLDKLDAIEMLSANCCALALEAVKRGQPLHLFDVREFKERRHMRWFAQVLQAMRGGKRGLPEGLLSKVHNWLLEVPLQMHECAYEYLEWASGGGVGEIGKVCQFLTSPYDRFRRVITKALGSASQDGKRDAARAILPHLKYVIKACLTGESGLLRVLSNLTLDEECRQHIVTLKGVEILVQFMEGKESIQIERWCARGLLNISMASRELRAKVLSSLVNVLQQHYRGGLDGVADGYISAIMKQQ